MLNVIQFRGTAEEWDAHVEAFPGSSFCHLAAWGDVLGNALGHDTYKWVAVDDEGDVHGLLPLTHVKSRLFGNYLVSMPFMSYGGPIGTEDARGALGRTAVEEARRLHVDLLELRARAPVPGDLATSHRKLTVIKALEGSTEELWEKGLRAKVRSQVRRPMKEGMTAHFGSDLVDDFYAVFSRTMRDLGTPVLPKSFFLQVRSRLERHVVFCVVRLEGEPVAAGCGFLWNQEFEITWAGASTEHNRMAPNMLLYWSLMEETVRRGGSHFNFGRCTEGSGTHRFKRQWDAEDVPLPWSQWSPSGVTTTPSPDSPTYRLATRVWSNLPLWVANRAGPILSRSLP